MSHFITPDNNVAKSRGAFDLDPPGCPLCE